MTKNNFYPSRFVYDGRPIYSQLRGSYSKKFWEMLFLYVLTSQILNLTSKKNLIYPLLKRLKTATKKKNNNKKTTYLPTT